MEKDVLTQEKRLLRRNKWAYSVGGIGRDMIYQLIATFFITYIQYSGLGLTAAQFSVIGVLLVVGRIWDAVNDPFMGSIVENTHSRWGKFRPWILIGALLSGIVIVIMFNFRSPAQWLGGWGYVIFFFIIYLFWEAAFTLNDIPYWSLIPALSKNKKDRDVITTMVVVFAGIGAFAGNAIISLTTVGNMVKGYSLISITFVAIFLACTFLTVFGVKEPVEEYDEKAEKVTLRKMFSVIAHNDQLLWASLALMLYSVGSALLTALGYNWFYLEIGYNGTLTMIFIVSFAVSNIVVQSLYAALAKKFTRKQLMRFSFISLAFGYTMLLALGWGGFLPVNIVTACVFGLFVFGGQAIFYMVIIVNMTNTIEYNEYKTGDRNEAIVFSLRPFVAKLSSAIQGLVVILVLVLSGIYGMSQNISELENQLSIFNEMSLDQKQEYYANVMAGQIVLDQADLKESEKAVIYAALQDPANAVFVINSDPADNITDGLVTGMTIDKAADAVFKNNDNVDVPMRLTLRLAITVLPALLIGASMLLLNKKFIIDEIYYEKITEETRLRREQTSGSAIS
ncbi:MAG TPA: glycoside-pentoside-hexuronide (GPH):cation symporter [Candidatus Izemoplasmatales bacterium]|nr:glycoside-pentoside-hexuronide (GPH):cation symporter [Bacillota bacterium]HRY77718.1 glycoside-pentoside-hexuronide (GPH):cation symporter [Candidatus Izemoplasmatales bacterium]